MTIHIGRIELAWPRLQRRESIIKGGLIYYIVDFAFWRVVVTRWVVGQNTRGG